MKKLTVTLLVLVMTATALLPAFSAGAAAKIPVINIVGEREVEVWNEDGTRYSPTEDMADAVVDEAIDELIPVFVKAFLTDDYDEWSRLALEKLTPIYDEIRPAPDGTLPENTGPYVWADMPQVLPEPSSVNWYYGYCWDFRRSPLDEAAALDEFIQSVKEKTGSDKVVLSARCGSSALAASYLYKYGTDDVSKVIFVASTLLGTPHADALLGDDIKVKGTALYSYLQANDTLSSMDERLVKFINSMLYAPNLNGSADGHETAYTAYGALVANSSGEANTAVCDGYSAVKMISFKERKISPAADTIKVRMASGSDTLSVAYLPNFAFKVSWEGDWLDMAQNTSKDSLIFMSKPNTTDTVRTCTVKVSPTDNPDFVCTTFVVMQATESAVPEVSYDLENADEGFTFDGSDVIKPTLNAPAKGGNAFIWINQRDVTVTKCDTTRIKTTVVPDHVGSTLGISVVANDSETARKDTIEVKIRQVVVNLIINQAGKAAEE